MNKNLKRIFIGFVILLIIVYGVGVIYFSENTYPKTTVNSLDRGLKSVNDVFKFDTEGYKLVLSGKDNKKLDIKSSDIELKKEVSGKPVVKQNVWMWPVEVFQSHKYDVDIVTKFNETKLENIVKSSDLLKNMVEPKDASIEIGNGSVTLIEEVEGNKIDQDKMISSIKSSIEKEESNLILKDEYILPKIYKDNPDLVKKYDNISKIYLSEYIFDFVDRKYNLSGDKLLEMYTFDDKYEAILNRDKLVDFVADIAIETDTYATPHKFKATGLGEVTVPGGIYGWQMNVADTVENIVKMIKDGKKGNVEIAYNQTANYREIDDVGPTYVEIDLSRQQLWYYEDGVLLLESPIVSGNLSVKYGSSPTGTNKIWSKERDIDLKGNSLYTGTPYSYPVKYWMPIGWTHSGIHDSHHRSEYGGDIYKTNGSSSCINMPLENVEFLFNNVEVDTPVMIYESSTDNSPTEFERQKELREQEEKDKQNEV